jgi:hypothetical protein
MPIIHDNSVFDQFRDDFMKRIELLKVPYGASFKDTDHDKSLMKGSRWFDDERIFYNFCSQMIERTAKEQGISTWSLDHQEAVKKILTMDQQEIDVELIEAMRDAAHGDYWYRYEKDWG